MGDWEASAFGNDTACDWAYELEESEDLEFLNATLDEVLSIGDDFLDEDLACEGLAACEVVARLKGNWGERNAYTEAADDWVEAHAIFAPLAPVEKALAVIERVLGDSSGLRDLWEDDGENPEWRAALADLRARVAG